jgi:formamidopyrimidine-DNA glycosylase
MPELPEVETTRRAIAQVLKNRTIKTVVLRREHLRWPIPLHLPSTLADAQVSRCERRGKYILLFCTNQKDSGWLLIHLGMSGSICHVLPNTPIKKHDHVDIDCGDIVLRYNDPRRFGAILWLNGTQEALPNSPLLNHLGVEPFSQDCHPQQLYAASRGIKMAIKPWLLAGKAVVGVGNIYCSETLFYAGLHPSHVVGHLTLSDCERLYTAMLQVLQSALDAGGTTLNDFVSGEHNLGQYQQRMAVYGRLGFPCIVCGTGIAVWLREGKAVGGRATYFCLHCQPIV